MYKPISPPSSSLPVDVTLGGGGHNKMIKGKGCLDDTITEVCTVQKQGT